MATLHYEGNNPAEALVFFRTHRAELRTLRRVIVNGNTTTVVDINGKEMALEGLRLGHPELVDLLNLVGASYDPATVHNESKGKDPTKIWEVVKADPWGQDRVA
jgi:hypothetical protein